MEDIYSIILTKINLNNPFTVNLNLKSFLNLRSVNRCAYLASFHTDFVLDIDIFIDLCKHKTIKEIEYIYSLFKVYLNKQLLLNIIIDLCDRNKLPEAKWFYNKFNLTRMDKNEIYKYYDIDIPFENICVNGWLEIAKWIDESLYHFDDELDFDLLGRVCFGPIGPNNHPSGLANNLVETADWLFKNFKFENDENDIHESYYNTFHDLLVKNSNRNLMVIQWYYNVCSVTHCYTSIISIITYLSGGFIEYNEEDVKIIKWLLSLVDPIKPNDIAQIMIIACINGKLDIAKFFYSLNANFKFSYKKVFTRVCEKGILDVAQWIHSISNINESTIKDAFLLACLKKQSKIVEWLFTTFNTSGNLNIIDNFYIIKK